MKRLFHLVAALALILSAKGQGTITFANYGVELWTGGDSSGYVVGLFLQGNDTPLAVTTFLEGTGFIKTPEEDVVVPGHAVNSTDSVFIVRAWESGKTFATSIFRAESASFTAGPLGGPNGANPPTISPAIDNLQAFIIVVPEPSTIDLAILGSGAIWASQRRKRVPLISRCNCQDRI